MSVSRLSEWAFNVKHLAMASSLKRYRAAVNTPTITLRKPRKTKATFWTNRQSKSAKYRCRTRVSCLRHSWMTPRFSTIRKARFRIARVGNKWLRLSPRPPVPPRLSYTMAEEAKVISVNKAAVKIALLIKTQKIYKVSQVNWIKYALKTNSSNVRKQITDRNIPIFSSITYSNRISRMFILQRRQS